MAAFGAAYRLHAEGLTPEMYDKNAYYGGHTASFRSESGFLFDVGPHISFTKDRRIQDLLAESVDQQYETVAINLNNYWRGYWPSILYNSTSTDCRKTSSSKSSPTSWTSSTHQSDR